MKKRLNLVRCIQCNKVIGADYKIKEIEKCLPCHRDKKEGIKQTASSAFARTKKGPALDLGELGRLAFRSGWERNFARWLVANKINWTFERVSFTFSISPKTGKSYKRKPWVYIPDFYDTDSDILYEVKGYLRSEDRSKIKRLKANYPKEFKKLKAVCSKGNKKAKLFYGQQGVPVIFIEDIKSEYKKLVKEDNWEGK